MSSDRITSGGGVLQTFPLWTGWAILCDSKIKKTPLTLPVRQSCGLHTQSEVNKRVPANKEPPGVCERNGRSRLRRDF